MAACASTDRRLTDQRTPLDLSVTTGKLVDGAVTSAKLATTVAAALTDQRTPSDLSVTTAKLVDGQSPARNWPRPSPPP